MEDKYKMLQIIYEIVKNTPHPLLYHCTTREILLRYRGNWQPEYLEELAREKLIQIKKTNQVVVLLTPEGFDKANRVFATRINF